MTIRFLICVRILTVFALVGIVQHFANPQLQAQGVARINGDDSRDLLGDGTNVIVGVIDSGIDDTHPGLAGTDSLGRTRMVAEGNFVFAASEGKFGGEHTAFFDLFRVEDGLIVEHWDVMTTIPTEMAHSNGKF